MNAAYRDNKNTLRFCSSIYYYLLYSNYLLRVSRFVTFSCEKMFPLLLSPQYISLYAIVFLFHIFPGQDRFFLLQQFWLIWNMCDGRWKLELSPSAFISHQSTLSTMCLKRDFGSTKWISCHDFFKFTFIFFSTALDYFFYSSYM